MALTRLQVRGLLGLMAGLLVGLGLLAWISMEAVGREHAARADQLATLRARMIADVVTRAGGFGDPARTAVARAAAADPAIAWVRVVRLNGSVLEVSTVATDVESGRLPRRLERSEKWLYDIGQELQAARATNLEEGSGRKHEVLVAREAAGGRRVAAPIYAEEAVAGLALVQTASQPAPAGAPAAPLLLAFAVPVLLLWAGVRLVPDRQGTVALLSAVLLAGALGPFSWFSARALGEARRQSAEAVAQEIQNLVSVTRAALPDQERPYAVADWDVDQFGRRRGLVTADGQLEGAALVRAASEARAWLWPRAFGTAIAALLLLLTIVLGVAAQLCTILGRHRLAYIYATPALAGMLLLVFFPFIYGLVLSFTGATIYNSNEPINQIWVGLRNFRDILTDIAVVRETPAGRVFNYQNFYWTLGFTIVWTAANVAIGVSVGLALALALNTPGLALRPAYRVLLILPWAVPNYITALVWRGMFHKQFGVINQALLLMGGDSVSWFEHPLTSFTAILATNGWLSFPFMMVISLGSLQSIPGELYEAARVDGATRWQQFRSITLPSLKPALVPAIILSVVWTFNMFNIPYLVSGGEPAHATEILITQAYKIAFEQYRYGYAAAYSMIIFFILLAYGTWQNRASRATEAV